jgi:hypothetical protein
MKKSALTLVLGFAALLVWSVPGALADVVVQAPSTVAADQPATFSVRAADSATVAFSVDGKTRWTRQTDGREFRRAGAINLPAGRHQFEARAVSVGGKSTVSQHTVTVKSSSKGTRSSRGGSKGNTGSGSGGSGNTGSTPTTPKTPTTPVTTPTTPTTPVTTPTTPTVPKTPTEPVIPTTPVTPPTEPTTPTTPPSTEGGQLTFGGTQVRQYLNQSAPGAVTEVPDPAGSGEKVFQLKVSNADVYPITPTENPRAELVSDQNIHSGAEFWASMKFYLPTDFPSSTASWLTLLEGPYGEPWEGTPPWHLEVNGTHIQWQRNGTYNWDIPWQMNLVRGSWVHVMLHERFAKDGWIEMWINGQPVTFFANTNWNPQKEPTATKLSMETMDQSTNIGPCSFHLMNYRKAGMLESATVDQGPLRIGTTRSSVEAP